MLDLVLRGGAIFDGTGAPPRPADLGIVDDRIAAVGDLADAQAAQVIDATGRLLAPGFIDIHTHTDETIFLNPRMESKIHQGVTTEVSGNCGDSAAPLFGAAYDHLENSVAEYGNLSLTWHSMGEYLDRVEQMGLSTNYVTFVGYGTLCASVMGYAMRAPTGDELASMQTLLARSMEEGAWGISTGLIYPPCSYASQDELIAVSRVAAERGGLYTSHIRNEGDRLLEAVEEALMIGQRAGIRVQLSHHKAAGKRNWGKVQQSLARIEQARADGLRVCGDQYPYVASSTGLGTVLPDWAHEGGSEKLVERLREPGTRGRMADEIRRERPGWENPAIDSGWHNTIIVGAKSDRALQGTSVWQLAERRGQDPVETACDLLIENQGTVQVIIFSMCEEDVQTVMRQDWVFVGSDATARAPTGPLSEIQCHPRTYGTFPRLLSRYVRELKVLTWEQAVAKMTNGPAQMLGLKQRGRLQEGYFADVVVFDPAVIRDIAIFTEPHQFPIGLDYVLVNGKITIDHGQHTGARAGKVLRHSL
jgi:N-acyl-D-amino-acid deacylase